jgi:phenol 2-monooxygenase
MPNHPDSYTDVLVIGAGPGGLMTAQALARLGVKVKVVERRYASLASETGHF